MVKIRSRSRDGGVRTGRYEFGDTCHNNNPDLLRNSNQGIFHNSGGGAGAGESELELELSKSIPQDAEILKTQSSVKMVEGENAVTVSVFIETLEQIGQTKEIG